MNLLVAGAYRELRVRGSIAQRLAQLLVVALPFFLAGRALCQTDVWLGGSGNWSDSTKWSAGVPTSTSIVLIDNGNGPAAVTVNGGYTCSTLTVDADASVSIPPGGSLTFYGTSISNSGLITLTDGAGGYASLYVAAGQNVTLTGGGTVVMNDVTHVAGAYIAGGSNSTLTNANNTIEGSGQIGQAGGSILVNQSAGVINANQSGYGLAVNPPGGATNQGLIEATAGGSLTVAQSITVNNASGTISSSGSGSTVTLIGDIQGGTLKTSSTGVMQGEGTLDGATNGTLNNNGTLFVQPGSNVTLTGTINNSGMITLTDGGGGYASLSVPASQSVTLTGGGTVVMNDLTRVAGAYIAGGANSTLTNVNNTIEGSGQIGQAGGLILVNQSAGTINANQSGYGMAVNPPGGATNQGLIEATAGGSLSVAQSITVNNASGTISSSGSGSTVDLLGDIQGGTLKTSNSGVMQGEGATLDGATHGTLSNAGALDVPPGNNVVLTGTIANSGMIVLTDGAGGYASLSIPANENVMLTGAGMIMMNDLTHVAGAYIAGGASSTLTNVNNKIEGSGQIGQAGGLALINQKHGVINANQKGYSLDLDAPNGTINQGLVEATGGSTLYVTTAVSNSGKFNVVKASLFQITGPFANFSGTTLTGGTYSVSGTLQFIGANIVTNAANITLSGTTSAIIDQSNNDGLRNLASTIRKGAFALHSKRNLTTPAGYSNAGTLNVGSGTTFTATGTYTQSAGSTTVDGTLVASAGTAIDAGTVLGEGRITSSLVSSGTVTAGNSATKTGILAPAAYTQNSNGSLDIAMSGTNPGTQYGQLAVGNGASLNGTLNVTLIDNFVPAIGDSFTILTSSVLTGQFVTVNLPTLSGAHFMVTYGSSNVILTVESGS